MGYNTHKDQKPATYEHQSWPAWFYGEDGQAQIFNGPDEVPEGWHDNPAKVGDKDAVTHLPGATGTPAADAPTLEGDEELGLPAYDDVTATQIKAMLDREGVGYGHNDDKKSLYTALAEALSDTDD